MRLRDLFRRRRDDGAAPAVADDAATATPAWDGGWRRAVADPHVIQRSSCDVTKAMDFRKSVASHQNHGVMTELGHRVDSGAPSGLVHGLLRPAVGFPVRKAASDDLPVVSRASDDSTAPKAPSSDSSTVDYGEHSRSTPKVPAVRPRRLAPPLTVARSTTRLAARRLRAIPGTPSIQRTESPAASTPGTADQQTAEPVRHDGGTDTATPPVVQRQTQAPETHSRAGPGEPLPVLPASAEVFPGTPGDPEQQPADESPPMPLVNSEPTESTAAAPHVVQRTRTSTPPARTESSGAHRAHLGLGEPMGQIPASATPVRTSGTDPVATSPTNVESAPVLGPDPVSQRSVESSPTTGTSPHAAGTYPNPARNVESPAGAGAPPPHNTGTWGDSAPTSPPGGTVGSPSGTDRHSADSGPTSATADVPPPVVQRSTEHRTATQRQNPETGGDPVPETAPRAVETTRPGTSGQQVGDTPPDTSTKEAAPLIHDTDAMQRIDSSTSGPSENHPAPTPEDSAPSQPVPRPHNADPTPSQPVVRRDNAGPTTSTASSPSGGTTRENPQGQQPSQQAPVARPTPAPHSPTLDSAARSPHTPGPRNTIQRQARPTDSPAGGQGGTAPRAGDSPRSATPTREPHVRPLLPARPLAARTGDPPVSPARTARQHAGTPPAAPVRWQRAAHPASPSPGWSPQARDTGETPVQRARTGTPSTPEARVSGTENLPVATPGASPTQASPMPTASDGSPTQPPEAGPATAAPVAPSVQRASATPTKQPRATAQRGTPGTSPSRTGPPRPIPGVPPGVPVTVVQRDAQQSSVPEPDTAKEDERNSGTADIDDLARRLIEPVSRLLRAELRHGRERIGRPHDRRR